MQGCALSQLASCAAGKHTTIHASRAAGQGSTIHASRAAGQHSTMPGGNSGLCSSLLSEDWDSSQAQTSLIKVVVLKAHLLISEIYSVCWIN